MTTEDMVVDVSQDWLQACSVQEHFMRGPATNNCRLNLSASCRQMRALGGDCYNFAFLEDDQGESVVLRLQGRPHMHYDRTRMSIKLDRNRS